MKIVIQRTKNASVLVEGEIIGQIDSGLMVLVGVTHNDTIDDAKYLARKLINLRIFEDEEKKMNFSLKDVKGGVLSVSQFTLYGDTKKGRRPSFIHAAKPEEAKEIYESFNELLRDEGVYVETGAFGREMDIHFINQGPMTFILDTDDKE